MGFAALILSNQHDRAALFANKLSNTGFVNSFKLGLPTQIFLEPALLLSFYLRLSASKLI